MNINVLLRAYPQPAAQPESPVSASPVTLAAPAALPRIAPSTLPIARSLEDAREARILQQRRQFLTALVASLQRSNAVTVAAAQRAEQKRLTGLLAAATETAVNTVRRRRRSEASRFDDQIRSLRFRNTVLAFQARVFSGRDRLDTLAQKQVVQTRLDSLVAQQTAILTRDTAPAVEAIVAPYRKQIFAESAARAQALASRLAQQTTDREAREAARMAGAEQALSSIDTGIARVAPLTAAEITPLKAFWPQTQFHTLQPASLAASARGQQRRVALLFAAATYADAVSFARQYAAIRGWRLVPFGTRGAHDITREVTTALRASLRTAGVQSL
ncbi:MAG: hypothetical protein KGJ62_14615 [Armatimonadetes bacterium]|nr:hypothetical protein [Armatimonadota bacterium]MDE2207281.1 hypothetical protein [Armatimonadota bacterium]